MRQAHGTDAPVLAAIHAAAFPPAEVWGPDAFALQLALPGVAALLDESGGFILIRVVADEAEILTLAVHPEARRQGIAARLIEAAAGLAAAAGAATLFLEVADRNTAARALYTSTGFTQAGLRKRYYPDGADALVMRRPLTSA